MKKVAVIFGSSRPSTAGKVVADWFIKNSGNQDGIELVPINLAEVNLPMLSEAMPPMMGQYEQDSTKQWAETIGSYDGFVFVVAEYNNGYTAILKNAIDTLFAEWNDKPTAVISYGAYPASTAAEQLRVVLAHVKLQVAGSTLHVTPIHQAISQDGELDESKVAGDAKAVLSELAGLL